jgi:hypothetical protein
MLSSRMVRAILTVAVVGWGARMLRGRRRSAPAYPVEATPRIPPSDTRSPS